MIWLPIWQASPTGVTCGEAAARAYSAGASPAGTPNLSVAPPVVIRAWPPAPILGLTRMAISGAAPFAAATAISRSSSTALSTLIWRTPTSMAKASSASVLPTPEKTIRSPGTPAFSARRISPSDTVSAPQPSRARVASTDRFELAFTAKAISASPSAGRCASTASRSSR